MWAREPYFQNNSTGGTFTFSNAPTALDGTNPGATGDPFASFLLGIPTGGTYQSSGWTNARTSYQAYFVDDSWQLNPKLTLNLGVRWEIPGVFSERDGRIVTFNPQAVNPILKGLTNPATGQPSGETSVDLWRAVMPVFNVAITGPDGVAPVWPPASRVPMLRFTAPTSRSITSAWRFWLTLSTT